jgi:DNA invertase Pin-like site-specific DNA recombinase
VTARRGQRRLGYGYRRGEQHPRAKLSDDDVRLVRELHEAGLGYRKIASKFEVSRSTIRDWCNHYTRTHRRSLP